MKTGLLMAFLSVCALAAFVSCNVGVSTPAGSDGGQGEPGEDAGGGHPGEDGGTASDGGGPSDGGAHDAGSCPKIAVSYPCRTDADCPSTDYTCEPIFPDMPQCGDACRPIDILTDGGLDGGCPQGSSGVATCVSDADCPPNSVCKRYLEGHDECGTYCEPMTPQDAGGPDAAQTCSNPCDCPYGLFCEAGTCVPPGGRVGDVYCCDRPCPTGAPCQHANGQYGNCAGDADVRWPDAGSCVGEGQTINKTGDPNPPPCCSGLEAVPLMAFDPAGGCALPGCDCVVCVKPCGGGDCSTGKNACNCPQDCPASIPGGPGSKCTTQKDCTSGTCMPEQYGYPTGGYCMGDPCDPKESPGNCPAGTVCTPMIISQALGHCMPACRKDGDCRQGLTCEWMPSYMGPAEGTYICWEAGRNGAVLPGKGLGKTCASDQDCLSQTCNGDPDTGAKECSVFCDATKPCKEGMNCKPMGGCGSPQCGACF